MDAVRQLANGIAHDFNNILGSVIGFAQFIVDDTDPALPQSQYAKRILTAGQRANALVSKILTFSRNRTPTRATCDLGGLVDETRELLAAIILTGNNVCDEKHGDGRSNRRGPRSDHAGIAQSLRQRQ